MKVQFSYDTNSIKIDVLPLKETYLYKKAIEIQELNNHFLTVTKQKIENTDVNSIDNLIDFLEKINETEEKRFYEDIEHIVTDAIKEEYPNLKTKTTRGN